MPDKGEYQRGFEDGVMKERKTYVKVMGGTIGGAVFGGMLFGPIGAILGGILGFGIGALW